ncbi:MAG: translational GTPase TypA [Deltaproteobacteria bacterium]|nr:translational GTPase TypA [Deltaproteobacteria bacterium]
MTRATNTSIRNIAIIAHVDHGKTTLVDALFRQCGSLSNLSQMMQQERVMDNLDLERERGITIAAKNCSVEYQGIKINIIDTPGHADFGGEVERALTMADGAILLVDAAEGPLPQTRFVLEKALQAGLTMMVIINKIDRRDARPEEVLDEIYGLFIDLGAHDAQIDFPVYYAIGRDGIVRRSLEGTETDLSALFAGIIEHVPPPQYDTEEPFQMLVCNIGYSDYTGRLAIGRVFHGTVRKNDRLVCMTKGGAIVPLTVTTLQVYDGTRIINVDQAVPGEIVVLAGANDVTIGDTICHAERPKALPRVRVDEPTVAMQFMGNSSPLAGREGAWVQTRRIFERLQKEALFNVAIEVDTVCQGDRFSVKGRGEFQLAVIIETMRREGYELCVGRPQILFHQEEGIQKEPIEHLVIDCEECYTGVITEKLALRKGRMVNMRPFGTGRVRLEFSIPTRGLIGYRSEFLTDTKGNGIMSAFVEGYEPHRGPIVSRTTGSLVADRAGSAVPYALFNLEPRGRLFVVPGDPVYEGMVIGEHTRDNDLNVNPTKEKKLTNMRAAGRDENVILTPVLSLTLEQAIEFIKDDELVEVTPKSIRLRKMHLDPFERKTRARSA